MTDLEALNAVIGMAETVVIKLTAETTKEEYRIQKKQREALERVKDIRDRLMMG